MMAKRPAERFASYEELLAILDRLAPSVTRPAGFWVRASAFALDVLIVALLALPLQLLRSAQESVVFVVAALYYTIALARWGRTLGKLAFELEVVRSDGAGRVGFARAAIRWLVELGPSYALIGLLQLFQTENVRSNVVLGICGTLLVAIPLLMGIAGAMSAAKRTLWDRAARTQVRYVRRG